MGSLDLLQVFPDSHPKLGFWLPKVCGLPPPLCRTAHCENGADSVQFLIGGKAFCYETHLTADLSALHVLRCKLRSKRVIQNVNGDKVDSNSLVILCT